MLDSHQWLPKCDIWKINYVCPRGSNPTREIIYVGDFSYYVVRITYFPSFCESIMHLFPFNTTFHYEDKRCLH